MEQTLKTAIKEGASILMKYFGKLSTYEVKESQSSIVTQADIESEAAIVKIIESSFPKHNIIAEETGYKDKNSNYTWIIDPLDGTSNFSAGIPWFGVIVCLMKDNKPYMAGVYLPFYDLLYYAEKEKGAFKNGEKINVSTESKLKNVLVSYSLDYSEDFLKTEKEAQIIKFLVQNTRNLRSTNCVVDFCYCADGRLGASLNQTTKIWDIAAPHLIIEEAGGVVTDIDGNPIQFTIDETNYEQNFTIVCANKILHSEITRLILGIQ